MSRYYYHTILLGCMAILSCQAQEQKPQVVESTDQFEFYINKWLNQHHFLFQSAKALAKDSTKTIASFPDWQQLIAQEQKITREAMEYYQTNWIDKSLLFNGELFEIKGMISYWSNDINSVQSDAHPVLVHHWKAFSPIYDKYFWSEQLAQNKKVLEANISRIRAFEEEASMQLSKLSQAPWPKEKIRVDVTYLADWAGAYTSVAPTHVVISTHEGGPEGDWVETVFHEASHQLIGGRRGAVSNVIKEIAAKEELEIPRQLWHGVLFYFAGSVIKDLLVAEGVKYELFMMREDVFKPYHKALIASMDPYLAGEVSLEDALRRLLISLQ